MKQEWSENNTSAPEEETWGVEGDNALPTDDTFQGSFVEEQLAPSPEDLPGADEFQENPPAASPTASPATWRCGRDGVDESGELLWVGQVASLLDGLLRRRYRHVVLAGAGSEWFAQCGMENNQIPYVELGIRVQDSYNQVLRYSPLRGSGMRVLDVLEIMEGFVRDESLPSEDKYTVDVYYY